MIRARLAYLILAIAFLASPLAAQESGAPESADLQVQLRSATGSNRFHVGEVIPLEVLISSSTPNRYLEPCELFSNRSFGFPMCRFFSQWSFAITPEDGWVDFTKQFEGLRRMSGPTFKVPNNDLTSQPVKFSFLMTSRFRFDKPGEYHIRLSIQVGIDDETTQLKWNADSKIQPHAVNITREIVLQIVPAGIEWQREIIRKGYEAYSSPGPHVTDPPTPELLQYQQATLALCNLGTPEAARVLANVFSQNRYDVQSCLQRSPSVVAGIEEMQRLLVDPEVAITHQFFTALVLLLNRDESLKQGLQMISRPIVDREREALFAALPQKRGEAQITSLVTVLQNAPHSKNTPSEWGFGYDLPFPPPVIAAAAANFDRLPLDSQKWLLIDAWDRVRSPLMLPVVRKSAEAGNGPALLRWLELDPAAATAFVRSEIVRPGPRFSSFYLRLPEVSLPDQERQIAANFVALTQVQELVYAATLLHRYATRAVLPTVLPFVDAKRAGWPCSIQFPVLAYLLKVSAHEAAPRVERALWETNHGPCNTNTFFTDIGFLQPSPILERLALAQIDAGTTHARDGADYLRRYGSTQMKPLVWARLKHWHEQFVARGAEKRVHQGFLVSGAGKRENYPAATQDDHFQSALVTSLVAAFAESQAWVLSPEESNNVQDLLGKETTSQLSCKFRCGAPLNIGPSPEYAIYSRVNDQTSRKTSPMEYLNSVERLHYGINQYLCADLKTLKQKLLQFPRGSTFVFAYDFTARDRDELVEISDFLWSHGYKVRNVQNWSFLPPDPRH